MIEIDLPSEVTFSIKEDGYIYGMSSTNKARIGITPNGPVFLECRGEWRNTKVIIGSPFSLDSVMGLMRVAAKKGIEGEMPLGEFNGCWVTPYNHLPGDTSEPSRDGKYPLLNVRKLQGASWVYTNDDSMMYFIRGLVRSCYYWGLSRSKERGKAEMELIKSWILEGRVSRSRVRELFAEAVVAQMDLPGTEVSNPQLPLL